MLIDRIAATKPYGMAGAGARPWSCQFHAAGHKTMGILTAIEGTRVSNGGGRPEGRGASPG